MLSQHYQSDRRDLSASVLFFIPIVKDVSYYVDCDVSCSDAYCKILDYFFVEAPLFDKILSNSPIISSLFSS